MKKQILVKTDELQYYIKDLRKISVITHERQKEIFERLKDPQITKTEKDLLYHELIKGNLRYVISVAKTYQNQGLDLLDLISEGNIGLIKAADRFDPNSGLKFISYAVWWIRQSIMSSLNENGRTIRIPSNVIQLSQKEKKKKLTENVTSMCKDEKEHSYHNLPHCVGLFNEINDEGDQLINIIPNLNIESPEDILNTPEEIKTKVNIMLNVLDDREKVIIERYFGLTGTECNLEELGEEFGCTKERVRQIRDKAIKKLRNESYHLLNYL